MLSHCLQITGLELVDSASQWQSWALNQEYSDSKIHSASTVSNCLPKVKLQTDDAFEVEVRFLVSE